MSMPAAICSTGLAVLWLNIDDLPNQSQPNQKTKLLTRVLDVRLYCNLRIDGQTLSQVQLDVMAWDGGTTRLCGSCTFCHLLHDSLRRELYSQLSDSRNSGVLQMEITIKRLEYRTSRFPWARSQSVNPWDVHLVLMRGHTIFPPDSSCEVGLRRPNIEVAFELFGEERDPVAKWLNIHRRPLDTSTLSEKNVAKICAWIRDCDENHDKCREGVAHTSIVDVGRGTYFLPTRLLDVGNSNENPRLINPSQSCELGSQRPGKINYMTLSYCWGSPDDPRPLLTTTLGTLATRMEGISIGIMPQTFRDAVTLARALDIRYIWIDSLCIIQDDTQDWQAESSKMAQIYSNAYLTVIAAIGGSCHDGFLKRDLPRAQCTIPLRSTRLGSLHGHLSLRYRRHSGGDKMADIREGRWVTRGWTFQEERLARRVLMFGETKFFLDCRSMERSEDTDMYRLRPDWVESTSDIESVGGGDITRAANRGRHLNQRQMVFDHWQILCNHYTARELTFPEDKLAAISGMANKIAEKAHSDYLAGLWKDNLMHDLLWHADGIATKPEKYRAPSWSWASLDGRVSWPIRRFGNADRDELCCKVLDAQTIAAGLDPFGPVKGGSIDMSALILEVVASWAGNRGRPKYPWLLFAKGEGIANASLDIEAAEPQANSAERKYWALLAGKCTGQKGQGPVTPVACGLLLDGVGRKGDDDLEEFKRVGIFGIFSDLIPSNLEGALNGWKTAERQRIRII